MSVSMMFILTYDGSQWGPDAQSCATSMALLVFPMLAVFDRALLSFNARCLVRRSPLAVAAGAHRAYTTAGDDLHTVTDGWEGFLSKLDRRKQRLIIRLCQLWKESFAPKVVSSKGHKKIADTHQRELAAALQQALDAVADRRRAAAGLTNIQRGATLNPVYAMLGKECDQSLAAVAALKAGACVTGIGDKILTLTQSVAVTLPRSFGRNTTTCSKTSMHGRRAKI